MLETASQSAANGTGVAKMLKPTDEYLDGYSTLYGHVDMLADDSRMAAYHDAIKLNAEVHFKGKVVLDVGCGTGVLSIWAAQAGARKVYAVEGSGIAVRAKELVAEHDRDGVITVLCGRLEDLELPEPVDVIVSEWMGHFLLRESMVQSVILARNRWLKPGGVMYPSTARILMAQLDDSKFRRERRDEILDAMKYWDDLASQLSERYSLNFSKLRRDYSEEHFDYVFRSAWLGVIPKFAVAGEPQVIFQFDMHNVTSEQLYGWNRTLRLRQASEEAPVQGLCGWFDVQFSGHKEAPAKRLIELDTSPASYPTHWGQTAVLLHPALTSTEVGVQLTQSAITHHDLNLTLWYGDTVASYPINDFRGYSELKGQKFTADEGEMADDGIL
eukprot:gnl/TRDRNA2_/TRDRNA2_143266_c0_seq2.p1 gnl/TRDRNA2_/TRDRNA2_143266_c0~~gnl/TRDRNA2_/TRDRNA2_143266_c0_seq2.p1  ORF type:complete len:419 (+),score=79.07 gnl/TRDRNA2_/TRDRNA2_143266_c0_seq2:100-1257(+)